MRRRIVRSSSPFTANEKRIWRRSLREKRFALLAVFNLLLIASLACSLPGLGREPSATATPTRRPTEAPPTQPPATPTPKPQPLPPDLVESNPFVGSEVGLDGSITLYFNQPMDRESAEAAFFGLPGTITWIDDSTLIFTPEAPLEPATQVDLTFDTSLKAANGLSAIQPINLTYQAVGYLQLTQRLPEPKASSVDPASAIVAAFNRPVVPLGGDPSALPPAFGLEPEAEGRGEWLNTSTYIFYPQLALAGGQEYTVRVREDLTGVDGSPLENPLSWSFTTQLPELVTASPEDGAAGVGLDVEVALTFNQPMEAESVAANLDLVDSNGEATTGTYTWNEDFTELKFKPDRLLKRDQRYTLTLGEQALSGGGTPLGSERRISFDTVPALAVTGSQPAEGGSISPPYSNVEIQFNAPIKSDDVLDFITLTPEVPNLGNYFDMERNVLSLYGEFAPETDYTLIVSPNLPDQWNGRLGEEFALNFRSLSYVPSLTVSYYTDVLFLTPAESSINAQVTNLPELSMTLGSLPQSDFQTLISPGGYDLRQNYQPLNPRTFERSLDIPRNQNTTVNIPLTPEGETLAPGFYFLRFNNLPENVFAGPYLLVVSNVNTTFKNSPVDSLIWATDLRDGSPVAALPATIYDENGDTLASGQTDADGVLATDHTIPSEPYGINYVILGEPGQETFSAALSNWIQGMEASNFGYRSSYDPPRLRAYLYTDRPIYRPGQTVFFRAIARQAYNGRYSLPDQASLPLKLFNDFGEEIETFDLPLSIFGTAHGSYTLPEDLAPGRYSLNYEFDSVAIQVAEYRKPEIDLSVAFPAEQALAGDSLVGTVHARYFFGAPAGNVPVTWSLFRIPERFFLPGYEVGKIDYRWLEPFPFFFFPSFGEQVATGEGETDAEGNLEIEVATEPGDTRYRFTLEVTATDESGQPVSARNSVLVNPAGFFIGVRPEAWVGQAGVESRFEVQVADWEGKPAGAQPLRAEFMKVVWEEQEPASSSPYEPTTLVPVYTPVASTDFTTGPDGLARVAFVPPEPGTYQLDVKGLEPGGEGALTQVLHWVGGPGQAVWPNLPNQRLRLTADKDSYQPGDTARVFVPNPLGEGVQALVTIERGVVLRHEVMALDGDGMLPVELGDEDAPNVYLSVTLLKPNSGQAADFRQGYLILPVEPVAQSLDVSLTSQPQRTEPGGEVRFGLQVKDSAGKPVQGEFSISVVDKAVLALADPNSEDILPAFYGEQPLSVFTSMSLAASTQRQMAVPRGGGGGGEPALPIVVREEFRDTAYWQADMVTDANGQVEVTVPMPDNLTTWEVDVRGTTEDTRVGQATGEVLVTKDLLVRPVTPRFLVVGDHALLATVVQNNTQQDLQVEVALQATGFLLDDPSLASQPVNLPAGGRARVEWWGTAQDVESVDLIFSAVSGEFQDAARPTQGALPVLRFTAPQTFGTSGTLDTGGDRLEVVSLPRSFDPNAGQLKVELAPSLGAAMLSSLDALEHFPYQCTEQTVSRFLPNLETHRVLLEFGIDDPGLQSRLDRTLEDGLAQLLARQGEDGGWGWWQDEPSDTYVTAYVLFGLVRAQDAGVDVKPEAIQRAVDYLRANLPAVEALEDNWEFDRLAFAEYVLAQTDAGDLEVAGQLYEARERLNPWTQALLALTLEGLSPGDESVQTLFSDLETSAVRSATGAHWENSSPSWFNMSTTLQATAVVLYALAQHDPASPLVADALRYLMANRGASGAWASTYETAWSLMALARVMQATGELAGNFEFAASLNDAPLASGEASQASQLTPVTASAPVDDLYPDDPNALLIQRGGGSGRLYYTAHLSVSRPVEEVEPLERGLGLTRAYYPGSEACPEEGCQPVQGARVGDLVTVRLTLTVPDTAYYLMVEDYLPAGAEVLDTSLKTSQQGAVPQFDPARPLDEGWGWWYFNRPQIYDDRIAWAADSLPPGTYELTYQLVILQPGEYRVLPARAYQFYFPEVQATSAGEVFEISQ